MIAILIVILSVVVGYVLRNVVLERLAKVLEVRTRSSVDEDLVRSLQRPVVIWAVIAGLYFGLLIVDVEPSVRVLVLSVLSAGLIVSFTWWLAEVVVRVLVVALPARPGQTTPVPGVVQNVVRTIVLLIGFVLLLGNFGISVTPMLTTLGIGGLAVALGLQETLSNVFAGIQLTVARNIRVGDVLRLENDEEAVLEDVGWRAVRMRRLLTQATVIVPNARLASDVITNHDLPNSEVGVLVDVGVHYSSDLERVETVACEVASEVIEHVDGCVRTFEPFVRYIRFGESSIDFTVHLRAKGFRESLLVRHEFIKRLSARFSRDGIVIPFPIRAINLDQEHAARVFQGQVPSRPHAKETPATSHVDP